MSQVSKYEVPNALPFYRQFIRYQNGKLQLLSPMFQSLGLRSVENGSNAYSVMIPVDPWLRQQFATAEAFVQQQVNDESQIYKPLWKGDMMYVRVAKWCQIFRQTPDTNQYEAIDRNSFGQGSYAVTIEVPYIYIGEHKNGEHYSLCLRVIQIVYSPEKTEKSTNISFPVVPSVAIKAPTSKGRRRKGRSNAVEAETDTPSTSS